MTTSTRSVAVEPSGSCPAVEPHNLRRNHVDRLTEHACLGLNPANAPAENAQSVNHRCMAVSSDETIRKRHAISYLHNFREIFQIHLMHDAGRGRNDGEIVERLLAPLEKFIALTIAFEFLLRVVEQCKAIAEIIHLHAVIDHQIDRHQRIDPLRISARSLHRRASMPDQPRTAPP